MRNKPARNQAARNKEAGRAQSRKPDAQPGSRPRPIQEARRSIKKPDAQPVSLVTRKPDHGGMSRNEQARYEVTRLIQRRDNLLMARNKERN